jgi:DNA polymerase-4
MAVSRIIAHVDMNSFFVSCERLVDPSLVGKPVVVGGPRDARGVVASASYEARAFGVHSAMPLREAAKRCPKAVFLAGNHALYSKHSRRVFALLKRMAPKVEYASIDEFYLDLTGCGMLYGADAQGMASRIRRAVKDRTGLFCTVAVASNKYVAKIAGKTVKPSAFAQAPAGRDAGDEGIVVVEAGREAEFLAGLPIEALHGAGEKTQPHLKDLGVRRIGDLARIPLERLKARFGEAGGEWLHEACRGVDGSPVESEHEDKSVGHEHTFDVDTDDEALVRRTLSWLTEKTCFRLRRLGRKARTVTLKLRYRGFETLTRARTVPPTCEDSTVARTALDLLGANWDRGRSIRLVGVSLSRFEEGDASREDWLFPGMGDARKEALARAADAVKRRFGARKVQRAASLDAEDTRHLSESSE